jgi:hypothetical protein
MRRSRWLGNRGGASLVELLVALTLLGIGGALSTRVLDLAAREIEGAELELRAVLLVTELHPWPGTPVEGGTRPAGPGVLVAEATGAGWRVLFEPPGGGIAEGGAGSAHSGGFQRPREWVVEGGP